MFEFCKQPHIRPKGWRRPVLTNAMRVEIRAKYAEALEEEPGLTRSAYAMRIAPGYGVSAAVVRNVLYSA